MKFELTNGVALSAGLVILFAGADWLGAVGKVVESGATRQLEETVAAESQTAAVEGLLLWERMLDRYRGVVRTGLKNPVIASAAWSNPDADLQSVENVLATLLDRVKGRGQAAVISSAGKVLSSTVAIKGTKRHSFSEFRAVQDSLGGAAIVRVEGEGDASFVVAASPIESANSVVGVLVVTAPIDAQELNTWALTMSPNSRVITNDRDGHQMASTFSARTKLARITQPGLIRISGSDHWASRRILNDDAGTAGHIVGLAVVSREPVWDLVGKVRRMVLLLGAVALLMTLLVSMFAPTPVAAQISQPALVSPVAVSNAGQLAATQNFPRGGEPDANPSVSDDLPPLRLGSSSGEDSGTGSADEGGAPNLGLAAQMAVAASLDATSNPLDSARNDLMSSGVSEVPTPEQEGEVTFGKGASPRPEAVDAMMAGTRPKSSTSPAAAPKPPEPPPAPVPASPGAFANNALSGDVSSAESAEDEVPSSSGASDLPSAEEWAENKAEPYNWDAASSGDADVASENEAPLDSVSAFDSPDAQEDLSDGAASSSVDFAFPPSVPPPFMAQDSDSSSEADSENSDASGPDFAFSFGSSSSDDSLPPPPFGVAAADDSIPPPPFDLGAADDADSPALEAESSSSESESDAVSDAEAYSSQETLMRPSIPVPSFTATFPRPSTDELQGAPDSIFPEDPVSADLPDPADTGRFAHDVISDAPASDAPSGVMSSVDDGASTIMTSGKPPRPPPMPAMGGGDSEATTAMEGLAEAAEPDEMAAFEDTHYRFVYDKFVGSKRDLGENVAAIHFEGFSAKLKTSEEKLIEKHGCKAVRFEVLVKGDKVSLRPQLVR